jgi:hypothetical protein
LCNATDATYNQAQHKLWPNVFMGTRSFCLRLSAIDSGNQTLCDESVCVGTLTLRYKLDNNRKEVISRCP